MPRQARMESGTGIYQGDLGKSRVSNDKWTFGRVYGDNDSQKIFQLIHVQVDEELNNIVSEGIKDFDFEEALSDSDFNWYNRVLRETAELTGFTYEWTGKSPEDQKAFIKELSRYLLSKAVNVVKEKGCKLIDAQGLKSGENQFEVF